MWYEKNGYPSNYKEKDLNYINYLINNYKFSNLHDINVQYINKLDKKIN